MVFVIVVVVAVLKLGFPIISWRSQFLVQTTLDLPLEDTKAQSMFTSLLFSVPLRVPIFLFNSCSGSFFSTSLHWHQCSLKAVCSLCTWKVVLPPWCWGYLCLCLSRWEAEWTDLHLVLFCIVSGTWKALSLHWMDSYYTMVLFSIFVFLQVSQTGETIAQFAIETLEERRISASISLWEGILANPNHPLHLLRQISKNWVSIHSGT